MPAFRLDNVTDFAKFYNTDNSHGSFWLVKDMNSKNFGNQLEMINDITVYKEGLIKKGLEVKKGE